MGELDETSLGARSGGLRYMTIQRRSWNRLLDMRREGLFRNSILSLRRVGGIDLDLQSDRPKEQLVFIQDRRRHDLRKEQNTHLLRPRTASLSDRKASRGKRYITNRE